MQEMVYIKRRAKSERTSAGLSLRLISKKTKKNLKKYLTNLKSMLY